MSFWSPHWNIYDRHQILSMDWFSRLQDMLEVSTACRSLKFRAFLMWCATRMSLPINMNIKHVYHHHMTFYGWRATFGDVLHGHSPETTLEIGKNMEKCPRCMVHTAVCPMKVASSHFLACIWGGAPSCWKLKLPSAFQAVRAFRTLKGLTQLWKIRRIYPKYMPKCSVGSTDHVCKFLLKNFA